MLHIIIPVFNRLEETKLCLRALDNQSYKNFKIYIINDGSTDATEDYLRENRQDIEIINGDGNLWWTGCMKLGIEYLLKININHADDYAMSLNQDVVLDKDSLGNLMEVATSNKRSLVSGITVDQQTKKALSSGSKTISWVLNLNYHPHYNQLYEDINLKNIDLDILIGRACIYPMEVFRSVGNFNPDDFPQYGGDSEYSCRAKKNGFDLIMVPKAVAYTAQDSTGLNPDYKRLSFREIIESFTSIRSANNLRMRTKFALKVVPKYALPSYLLLMYLKILIQSLSTFLLPQK